MIATARITAFTALAIALFVGLGIAYDSTLTCLNNVAAQGACLP